MMGGVMLALVAIHAICHAFVDYKDHMMGALMERDMRNEMFDHYQKLSFKFYDDHRTGQLTTRISNDTFDLAELYPHGPEDIVIASLNFTVRGPKATLEHSPGIFEKSTYHYF